MREAMLYHAGQGDVVVCDACAHRCRLGPSVCGLCGVRANRDGALLTFSDDRIASAEIVPVERAPFFHVRPGSLTLAVAGVGDNFHCRYCAWSAPRRALRTDRGAIPGRRVTPRAIVDRAVRNDAMSITFTHSEPTACVELVIDTARIARDKGLGTLLVTNGYMTAETLDALVPHVDAACVALRGFDDEIHRRLWGARLQPVVDTIRRMKRLGLWVEVTTLVLPGLSDSVAELAEIASFLADVGSETPWHLGACPSAWESQPVDPGERFLLEHALEIGREAGLRHVYCAGVADLSRSSTHCRNCDVRIVERGGYEVRRVSLARGHCPSCGTLAEGLWGDAEPFPERRGPEDHDWRGAERRQSVLTH